MNILCVIPYMPSRVRTRPYHLIRGLSARGHAVTLATLWTGDAERRALEEFRPHCREIWARSLPPGRSAWNCLVALPSDQPLQAAYSWQPELVQMIRERLERGGVSFDVVHVEHLRGARCGLALRKLFSEAGARPPIVWDSVDCISFLFRQASERSRSLFGRWVTRFEAGRTARYEARLLCEFDHILATSALDADALQALRNGRSGGRPITVLTNGVDQEYFAPGEPGERIPGRLIMSGKMSYHGNVSMAVEFVQNILPRVVERHPHVEVWIVGKDPAREVRALARPGRVHVTGAVPDLRPFLRSADVAVAPLTYGAGVQNKVLEAMSCGTPIVMSDIAARGLYLEAEREALVRSVGEEFAAGVNDLLANQGARAQLGNAGRRYVQEHHDWNRITSRLEGVYDGLVRARG